MSEKNEEILKEVLDEIESALKDPKGIVAHQRRLAFALSLGMANLIELYLHKLNILKEGSKINHLWFKKSLDKLKDRLQRQIVSSIDSLENIERILQLARKIEEKRDELAYGSPSTEEFLQEKINLFFELKDLVKC